MCFDPNSVPETECLHDMLASLLFEWGRVMDDATDKSLKANERVLNMPGESKATRQLEARVAHEEVRAALFGGEANPPKIGRYRIAKKIGAGGMGEVFAAEDPELTRLVAIKLVRSDRVNDSAKRRIKAEARAMAQISHPNVATVHEVGEDQGRVFIAMELVNGVDLGRWAKAERRRWREVLDVYVQAGAGLAAAHAASVVHRDFKPHNAVLGDDGRVRVLDFGLVGEDDQTDGEHDTLDPEASDMTQSRVAGSGALLGSPAYMSPEQYLRHPVTAASDQFSFCIALHEALYGGRPFVGASLRELATQVVDGEPQLGTDRAVPGWIRDCLRRGLQHDPRHRWPSMDDLLDALRSDPRRRRVLVAAGATAIIGAVAVAGWYGLDKRSRSELCDREGQALSEVWDESRALKLGAAVTAVERPHAVETWQRTRTLLDDYATTWSGARREVCRREVELDSTLTLTQDQVDAASRCLRQGAAQLETLVATLARPTPDAVDNAVSAAAKLPQLTLCTDASWLEHLPPLPQGSDREVAELIDQQVADARARVRMGQLRAAQDTIDTALAQAVELGNNALRAEAEFARGQILAGRGEFADSVEMLEISFFRAEAAGHDRLALLVAAELSRLLSLHGEGVERAELWQNLAEARLDRLRQREHLIGATVLDSRSSVESKQGHYEAARDASAEALAIRERELGATHPELTATLNDLGNKYNMLGKADLAQSTHERTLELAQTQFGPAHKKTGIALASLAAVHLAEARFEVAIPLLEQAVEIHEAWSGPNHADVAALLNNLGIGFEMVGQVDRARSTYKRALSIWEGAYGPRHPDVALVLSSIGAIESASGNLEAAFAANERALSIYEQTLGPDHPNVATALILLAGDHNARGQHEVAREQYERAHRILLASLGEDHDFVAVPLAGLGAVHRARGDAAQSLSYYEQSLAVRIEAGANPVDLAESRFGVAKALVAAGGDRARAVELAEAARSALSTIPSEATLSEKIERWLDRQ